MQGRLNLHNLQALDSTNIARPDDDGASVASVATSCVSYVSTMHSTQRREEREIAERDIQHVLKHGKASARHSCNANGPTWIFEHDGIKVITGGDMKTVITVIDLTNRPQLPQEIVRAPATATRPARPKSVPEEASSHMLTVPEANAKSCVVPPNQQVVPLPPGTAHSASASCPTCRGSAMLSALSLGLALQYSLAVRMCRKG